MSVHQLNWGELTVETFLRDYWQKKPLLIKNGFTQFVDPISADELAGLAMEEEIESRIIAHQNHTDWDVQTGPFDAFDQFGEDNWTLLVQAVNNWSRSTNALLTPFEFIPNWRIDDVMVSFSTPNGGVGPHLDQYDVFIIQGEGKRRWQVGAPNNSLQALLPHPDLKQVSSFDPIIDEITEAGDILYIPPNHPHNGVAIENSLNYSIGFQAPNTQDLWSAFADKLLDENLGEQRLPDSDRQFTTRPELLAQDDIEKIKAFMLTQLNEPALFNDFVSKFLTQNHHTLEILVPMTPIATTQLDDIFANNEIMLVPVCGIKSLVIEQSPPTLYINGEGFELCAETQKLGDKLASRQLLTAEQVKSFIICLKNAQLLTSVLNKGYWYIE